MNSNITIEEKIIMNEENVRKALKDYGRYTDNYILEDVSDAFIRRLAKDSTIAKEPLRQMFRKSPAWCEELDALVINGNRTHDPDYNRINDLAWSMLQPVAEKNYASVCNAIDFFTCVDPEDEVLESYIRAIESLAPRAYAKGKKKSRIFRDICVALGVWDDTAGSKFQHDFAQFADELSSKLIDFKLYVSLNPAHFITMSNPKRDSRGATLTSCHSFNSVDYEYNNGCSGYARDGVSFIAFTAADPSSPETLNNRKTSRQMFFYLPGNGLLLQSRLYNTRGGTRGAQSESKVYRDLIQREISFCEGQPNLWSTYRYYNNEKHIEFLEGDGFGGYPDWIYSDFNAKFSIRRDCEDNFVPFSIGTYGICISCADETSDGLYCNGCYENDHVECADCGRYFHADDLYLVHDVWGGDLYVCESCRDEYYRWCEDCDEYYPIDYMTCTADGTWVCRDCRDSNYTRCCHCGEWVNNDDIMTVYDANMREHYLCGSCAEDRATECSECGELFYSYVLFMGLCPDCLSESEEENEQDAV